MKFSPVVLLVGSTTTTMAYPAKRDRWAPSADADQMGQMIEYLKGGPPIVQIPTSKGGDPFINFGPPVLDLGPADNNDGPNSGLPPNQDPNSGPAYETNPSDAPRNYSTGDNIERDHGVHCYHFPLADRKGAKTGYRKCYHKEEPCNVKWRKDAKEFREFCTGKIPKDSTKPICSLMWEPDIESGTYCAGKNVQVDEKGNRVMPCGKPAGIGEEATCYPPRLDGPCTQHEDCETLEPDVHPNKCRGVWSACEENFVKICAGSLMPCQSNCGNPDTCTRHYPEQRLPKGVLLSLDWDMVSRIPEFTVSAVNYTAAADTQVDGEKPSVQTELFEAEEDVEDEEIEGQVEEGMDTGDNAEADEQESLDSEDGDLEAEEEVSA